MNLLRMAFLLYLAIESMRAYRAPRLLRARWR
jgi:hypothetical protein